MRSLAWLIVVALGLTTAGLAANTPGGPKPHSVHPPSGQVCKDVAVSPTGNQMAVVTETGVIVYRLTSTGGIGSVIDGGLAGTYLRRVLYTPNGQRLFVLGDSGRVYWQERTTGSTSSLDLQLPGRMMQSCYMLEDPPLLFFYYAGTPEIYVLNHRDTSKPLEKIPVPVGMAMVPCLLARADASLLFTAMSTASDGNYLVHSDLYKGPGQSWTYDIPSRPTSACVGPGPDQLMFATRQADLHIVRQDNGQAIVGCSLGQFDPMDMAYSNDGYFAVLLDWIHSTLRAVSGHDLRQRLDPANPLALELVRFAECSVASYPVAVTMHPTRPIAYVASDEGVQSVDIKIPGIQHPLGQ